MTKQINLDNITIFVEDDLHSVARRAADVFAAVLTAAPAGTYGFATGSTPVGMYQELIARYRADELDFGGITAFNLDEYYPIAKSNDQSYEHFMKTQLFDHINVSKDNIDIPNGEAIDPEAECMRYEKAIRANANNFELQVLGIGENGHIGFNEPTDHFPAHTNYVELDKSTINANARFFDAVDDVPKHALTMGVGTIMMAKRVLLIATGFKKSDVICQTLLGAINPCISASALQMHRDVTVVLDADAACALLAQL
ncbi:MAG: glucosamine-6-phosphate deaminase [Coriobacteriia bacterium]|nr:glucosamine-6-phosphate deaminase [Coriobacteriia bacterium]